MTLCFSPARGSTQPLLPKLQVSPHTSCSVAVNPPRVAPTRSPPPEAAAAGAAACNPLASPRHHLTAHFRPWCEQGAFLRSETPPAVVSRRAPLTQARLSPHPSPHRAQGSPQRAVPQTSPHGAARAPAQAGRAGLRELPRGRVEGTPPGAVRGSPRPPATP